MNGGHQGWTPRTFFPQNFGFSPEEGKNVRGFAPNFPCGHAIIFPGTPRLFPGGLIALEMKFSATGSLGSHTHRTMSTKSEVFLYGPPTNLIR